MKTFLTACVVLCVILPVALSAPFDRHGREAFADVDDEYETYSNGKVRGSTVTLNNGIDTYCASSFIGRAYFPS